MAMAVLSCFSCLFCLFQLVFVPLQLVSALPLGAGAPGQGATWVPVLMREKPGAPVADGPRGKLHGVVLAPFARWSANDGYDSVVLFGGFDAESCSADTYVAGIADTIGGNSAAAIAQRSRFRIWEKHSGPSPGRPTVRGRAAFTTSNISGSNALYIYGGDCCKGSGCSDENPSTTLADGSFPGAVYAYTLPVGEVTDGLPLGEAEWKRLEPQAGTVLPGGNAETALRFGAALFALPSGQLVLWGGHAPLATGPSGSQWPSDASIFDLATNAWTSQSLALAGGRRSFAHFLDEKNHNFYVLGGITSSDGTTSGSILRIDVTTWSATTISPTVLGGSRVPNHSPAFAWDPAARRFVFFGGRYAPSAQEDFQGNSQLWSFNPDDGQSGSLQFRDGAWDGNSTFDWPNLRTGASMVLVSDPARASGNSSEPSSFLMLGGTSIYGIQDMENFFDPYLAFSDYWQLCVAEHGSSQCLEIASRDSDGHIFGAPLIAQTVGDVSLASVNAWTSSVYSNAEFIKQADDFIIPGGEQWQLQGVTVSAVLNVSPWDPGWDPLRSPIGFRVEVYANDPNGYAGQDGPVAASPIWSSVLMNGTGSGVRPQVREPFLVFPAPLPLFSGGMTGNKYWISVQGVFDTPWCQTCTSSDPAGTNRWSWRPVASKPSPVAFGGPMHYAGTPGFPTSTPNNGLNWNIVSGIQTTKQDHMITVFGQVTTLASAGTSSESTTSLAAAVSASTTATSAPATTSLTLLTSSFPTSATTAPTTSPTTTSIPSMTSTSLSFATATAAPVVAVGERSSSGSVLLPAVLGTIFGLFCLCCVFLAVFIAKRKNRHSVRKESEELQSHTPQDNQSCSDSGTDNGSTNVLSMSTALRKLQELANIEVQGRIGAGNFGAVYRGDWAGTPVALKLLKGEEVDMSELENEAELLSKLNHPNCINLLGRFSGCLPGHDVEMPFLVFEFAEAGTVLDVVRQFGNDGDSSDDNEKETRPTPAQVAQMVGFLCDTVTGMIYLSSRGILHRDLACRNLLVKGGQAKVCDFGLSRALSANASFYSSSSKKAIPVRWCSPEVLTQGTCTTKSDVYSFGVTALELLSLGRVPFAGLSNEEVCDVVLSGSAAIIQHLKQPRGCPDQLYALIRSCLSFKEQKRPDFIEILPELVDIHQALIKSTTDKRPAHGSTALAVADDPQYSPVSAMHTPSEYSRTPENVRPSQQSSSLHLSAAHRPTEYSTPTPPPDALAYDNASPVNRNSDNSDSDVNL